MPGLIIKPRSRIFHGHEWVYSSEIQKTYGNPEPGEVISLKDFKDRPLGTAIYNPASQIVARRISRRKQALDAEFFRRRISQAIAYRESQPQGADLARIVWSESDGVPGLIVDRYHDHLVMQTTTLAMDQRKEQIAAVLVELCEPKSIILRNDSPMRKAEGLENEIKMLHGDQPAPFTVQNQGITYEIDPANGQKTGLYLDIMDAYSSVAKYAKDKEVLDVFCNQGGFGLNCAKAGAKSVTSVDISEEATKAVTRNAELSGLSVETLTENAFTFLRHHEKTTISSFSILRPSLATRRHSTTPCVDIRKFTSAL